MQTDDHRPSAGTETPGEAAGGSVRKLLDDLRIFAEKPVLKTGSGWSVESVTTVTQSDARRLISTYDEMWTQILLMRTQIPKIDHSDARRALQSLEQNFDNNLSDVTTLRAYIDQQALKERDG